jgi:hypothetical protein
MKVITQQSDFTDSEYSLRLILRFSVVAIGIKYSLAHTVYLSRTQQICRRFSIPHMNFYGTALLQFIKGTASLYCQDVDQYIQTKNPAPMQ